MAILMENETLMLLLQVGLDKSNVFLAMMK